MERIPVPKPDTAPQPVPEQTSAPGANPLEAVLARLEERLDRLIEIRLETLSTRQSQDDRQTRIEQFAASHPDFRELLESGVLEAIRAENPLLDDIGAYLVHRLASEQDKNAQALDQARREAAAKAESSVLERLRTKRLAATLSASPGGPGRGQAREPELDAPEQFGGLTSVLASRLEARRTAAGH
ncbi:MAG: hypothetical protein AB7U59_11615 [Desulfovibrionaceae bacterium]|jgi:hypothetical protein